MLENYEINLNTIAILSIDNNTSKVYEDNDTFYVKKNQREIIDDSCKYFGSSFLGRHEGTKNLIGVNYKSPIIIEETRNIIFFPTSSPRFNDCNWIALNKIKSYHKYNNKKQIIFINNEKIEIDISYGSLTNQILRATLLESTLNKRKKIEKNAYN